MTGIERPLASGESLTNLIRAARDSTPVSGLTHNFYRYPARFSPAFVRAAIEAFSKPGDWILDPFAGGGTTLVEAVASGRNVVGVDINALATFVCEAKTLQPGNEDIRALRRWALMLSVVINMHADSKRATEYESQGYYKNLDGARYWRLRKAIEQALDSATRLLKGKALVLARCILLKTAQWALDARKRLPSVAEFRCELMDQADAMIAGALELRRHTQSERVRVLCLNRPVAGLEVDPEIIGVGAPRLIVTSPPYPGIHVLYHRWQVDGRKEAPAPFWIANRLDGAGSSYYTMGDRHYPGLKSYFEKLEQAFSSIARVCGPKTTIVQMVAFSEPAWQLPRYLQVLEACGLKEIRPWDWEDVDDDGRLWRDVPNRKWHARQKTHAPGSREVVLVHRRAKRADS